MDIMRLGALRAWLIAGAPPAAGLDMTVLYSIMIHPSQPARMDIPRRDLGEHRLKGLAQPLRLFASD